MLLLVVLASARGSFRAVCLPPGNWGSSHRKEKKRKHSSIRQLRAPLPIELRVLGGPNATFLECYCLDNASHLMDWFTTFMPLTPKMNCEDPGVANIKGNKTTKFAISNWTAYSNTKAMMCNLVSRATSLLGNSSHSRTGTSFR